MDRIDNDRLRYLTLANRGLIAFRLGNEPKASALYREAIEGFAKIGMPHFSARASVFFAREAVVAGSEHAGKLLSEAEAAMKPFQQTETMLTLHRVEALLKGLPWDAALAAKPLGFRPASKLVTAHLPSGESKQLTVTTGLKPRQ